MHIIQKYYNAYKIHTISGLLMCICGVPKPTTSINIPLIIRPMVGRFGEVLLDIYIYII